MSTPSTPAGSTYTPSGSTTSTSTSTPTHSSSSGSGFSSLSASIIEHPPLGSPSRDSALSSLSSARSAASSSSSSSSSSGYDEEDAEAEWQESLQQLELLLSMVLVPFLGKWVGRRCAYWAWAKFMTWKYPVDVVITSRAKFNVAGAVEAVAAPPL